MDNTPPVLEFCHDDITETVEGGEESKLVHWSDPVASDLSGNVSLSFQSHFSGDRFPVGNTKVTYIFVDSSGNSKLCEFYVRIRAPSSEYAFLTKTFIRERSLFMAGGMGFFPFVHFFRISPYFMLVFILICFWF